MKFVYKKYFLLILLFLLFGCTSNNKNLEETKINYDIILKLKETTKIVVNDYSTNITITTIEDYKTICNILDEISKSKLINGDVNYPAADKILYFYNNSENLLDTIKIYSNINNIEVNSTMERYDLDISNLKEIINY